MRRIRQLALVPTFFLLLAWLCNLLALLAGKNGQMLGLQAIGANISRAGFDILADTTLFNLDPENFMYGLLATENSTILSNAPKPAKQVAKSPQYAKDPITQPKAQTAPSFPQANQPSDASFSTVFTKENRTRLSTQPTPVTPTQSLSSALAENIADLLTNGSHSTNPLAQLLRANKPLIATTLRATANSYLNDQITRVRTGFSLPGWVAIYQTQWCWGEYDHKNNKIVSGCTDSRALEDLNLAPGIRRTMELMDVQRETPERIDLPNGMLKTVDGLQQFTYAVYVAEITLAVLTGMVWIASFANVFAPEKVTYWSDFGVLGMCLASGAFTMLLMAPYIVFEYFNSLVLPGLLSLFSIRYDNGWRFVTLHIAAELLTIVGTGFWIVLERRGYRDKVLLQELEVSKRDTNIRVFLDDKPRF